MVNILRPGIYVPTQVFYESSTEQALDSVAIAKHAVRMAKAGAAGIVTNGSNGEAVYLTASERAAVTKITRHALDQAGYTDYPIIVGASDQSVAGTVALCKEAAEAGGDAVLVMVPSFFKWAMNTVAIERFFLEVADRSPLPLILYNYPGAVAGIDLDSDLIIRLSKHKNIIGTKFTCGNVGKLARVAASTNTVSEALLSKNSGDAYFAFAGIADFISPSVEVGGTGAIVGAANVFPRACVEAYKLAVEGKRAEAAVAQQRLALADWELTKRAIPGFKAILDKWSGYGGLPRSPMAALGEAEKQTLYKDIEAMMEYETSLPDFGSR